LDQIFLTTKESKKTSDCKLLIRLSAKTFGCISSEAEEWLQKLGITESNGVTENEYF
jgi:hypothetical protein